MPWETDWTIRLCVPGIDQGGAVWLEAKTCDATSEADAWALIDRIVEVLRAVRIPVARREAAE